MVAPGRRRRRRGEGTGGAGDGGSGEVVQEEQEKKQHRWKEIDLTNTGAPLPFHSVAPEDGSSKSGVSASLPAIMRASTEGTLRGSAGLNSSPPPLPPPLRPRSRLPSLAPLSTWRGAEGLRRKELVLSRRGIAGLCSRNAAGWDGGVRHTWLCPLHPPRAHTQQQHARLLVLRRPLSISAHSGDGRSGNPLQKSCTNTDRYQAVTHPLISDYQSDARLLLQIFD